MIAFLVVFVALFFGDDVGKMLGLKDGLHADLIGIPSPTIIHPPKHKPKIDAEGVNPKDNTKEKTRKTKDGKNLDKQKEKTKDAARKADDGVLPEIAYSRSHGSAWERDRKISRI